MGWKRLLIRQHRVCNQGVGHSAGMTLEELRVRRRLTAGPAWRYLCRPDPGGHVTSRYGIVSIVV